MHRRGNWRGPTAARGTLLSALRWPQWAGTGSEGMCVHAQFTLPYRRNLQDAVKRLRSVDTQRGAVTGVRAASAGKSSCALPDTGDENAQRRGGLWPTPACCFPAPPARPTLTSVLELLLNTEQIPASALVWSSNSLGGSLRLVVSHWSRGSWKATKCSGSWASGVLKEKLFFSLNVFKLPHLKPLSVINKLIQNDVYASPLEGCLEGIRYWHMSDQPCMHIKYLSWRTARVMRAKKRCWWSRSAMRRQKNLRISFLAQNKSTCLLHFSFFHLQEKKLRRLSTKLPSNSFVLIRAVRVVTNSIKITWKYL